jgi:hypothetical protein
MTPDEVKRRAEAVYRWAQAHDAGESECPVCGGVKWEFRPETPGPYVPRVCFCCGYVQWFDARKLGLAPDQGASSTLPATGTAANGDNAP